MISLDCYIGLETSVALDRSIIKAWFTCVKVNAPDGMLRTVQTTDEKGGLRSVALVTRELEGRFEYLIPLCRNLTEDEGKTIIEAFDMPDEDFDITMSSAYGELVPDADAISIDDAKYTELCTAWAKRQHDTWMSDRVSGGWRYGPTVNVTQRTHPLIKAWSDLPDEHRNVDLQAPSKMIALMNDSGYAIISRDELTAIMNLIKSR